MAVLNVMQRASRRLLGKEPTVFFSSRNDFEAELVNLLNEVARDICLSHDWQGLTKVHTYTGDGVSTSFAKPDDYDRMVLASEMADADSWFWHYSRVPDLNMWITIQNGYYLGVTPGWWILLDDEFQFNPAPASGARASFPYISTKYARTSEGVRQPEFTKDSDSFILDERLLELGLIWRWREMKHLDVTGDQAAFQKAFDEQAGRDKGARVIRGVTRPLRDVPSAYPWPLGA